MKRYMDVKDLEVYRVLCQLYIEVCEITSSWPSQERYELGTQVRRSSNSAPAQLAEKNDDRHIRNKIEGINRSRGEAAETIHHLFMATLKHYITDSTYDAYSCGTSNVFECSTASKDHWRNTCLKKTDDGTLNDPAPRHRTLNTDH